MDRINLAQDTDRCRGVVNVEMNFGFHNMRGISWLAEELSASQEGICPIELVSYYFVFHFSLWTNIPAGETASLKTSSSRRLNLVVSLTRVPSRPSFWLRRSIETKIS